MPAPCSTRSVMPKPRSSCRLSRPRSPTTPKPGWCRARCRCRTTRTPLPKPRSSAISSWPQAQRSGEERSRGLAQAYLSLSRIAEKRKDYALAGAWLDKIENPQDLVAAQTPPRVHPGAPGQDGRGAQAAARPARTRARPTPARSCMAEVQLLREHKQYKAAYDLLAQAAAKAALRRRPASTTRRCWPRRWTTCRRWNACCAR